MGYHSQIGLDMTIGDYEEQKRLDRREWAMNTWRNRKVKPAPKAYHGYISEYDVEVMTTSNKKYWRFEVTDTKGNPITIEQSKTMPCIISYKDVVLLVVGFENGYWQTVHKA